MNAKNVIDEMDDASIGSISEIDELDLSFLFNGDHSHQFEGIHNLGTLYKDTIDGIEKTHNLIKSKQSNWSILKDFICCQSSYKRMNALI